MSGKIHTRKRRYLDVFGERSRSSRVKTFRSEDSAKKWAESQGLKKYSIEKLRFGLSKKFRVKV